MERKKIYISVLFTAVLALGMTANPLSENREENLLTGKFTEAGGESDLENTQVEEIYWDFGDGETARGRLAQHNYTNGTYNVTVTVVKENGENETYRGRIRVGK